MQAQRVVATVVLALMLAITGWARRGREQPDPEYALASPFDALRWVDGMPEALVGERWGRVVSIDDVGVEEILDFCRRTWGERWVGKRFEEDLVEVMTRMGHAPKDSVRLTLRAADGEEFTVNALMTREKRMRLWRSGLTRSAPAVSRAQAEEAIRQAAALLASSHSYSNIAGAARDEALVRRVIDALPEKIAHTDVESAIFALVAPTGDGHASVRTPGFPETGPFLAFLPAPVGEKRIAAVKPDRSGLLDPAHPFIESIEGVEIDRWMKEASAGVAAGSPQLVRERSARRLRSFGALAPRVGLGVKTAGEMVTVVLSDGKDATRSIATQLDAEKPEFGSWPRTTSRVIDEAGKRIGYLRIPEMDGGEEFERDILARLEEFDGCAGIIIDVRGNGGGRRDLINILCPRLPPPDAEPVVYNASRPLLLPGETESEIARRLGTRFLFREDDARWTDAERAAIRAFRERFQPDVEFAEERFGPWHYAVVSPAPAGTRRITVPVVVLMDAGCFSATDVFLAAMKLMPNVTLLGEASGGGSGLARSHEIRIPADGPGERAWRFEVRLSTMASFTAAGELFDRRGIQPHVVVERGPEYFVRGGFDAQLDAALRRIVNGEHRD